MQRCCSSDFLKAGCLCSIMSAGTPSASRPLLRSGPFFPRFKPQATSFQVPGLLAAGEYDQPGRVRSIARAFGEAEGQDSRWALLWEKQSGPRRGEKRRACRFTIRGRQPRQCHKVSSLCGHHGEKKSLIRPVTCPISVGFQIRASQIFGNRFIARYL
jgi:hypothetical protein